MTSDEALKEAERLNDEGTHRHEWFYYPAFHYRNKEWFVMRRRRDADVRIAVFGNGNPSINEGGS